jgi:hypothetical protein
MAYKTKRDIAVSLLAYYGRYIPDAPNLKYHARIKNKSFHATDTYTLTVKIADGFSMKALRDIKKELESEGVIDGEK